MRFELKCPKCGAEVLFIAKGKATLIGETLSCHECGEELGRVEVENEYISFTFVPEPDITAYELAQLVPLLIPNRFRDIEKAVEKLPPECKRHVKLGSNEVTD